MERILTSALVAALALAACSDVAPARDPCAAADAVADRHAAHAAGLGFSEDNLAQHRAAARRAHVASLAPGCVEMEPTVADLRFPELPTPPAIPDDLLPTE
jgi:hypothetical protein